MNEKLSKVKYILNTTNTTFSLNLWIFYIINLKKLKKGKIL